MRAPKATFDDYETDLARWFESQARALRERRFADLDVPHLIEEVEGLAGRDRRELGRRIEVVLVHLLKLAHQPDRASRSWRTTIFTQRRELERLFEQSPSLQRLVPQMIRKSYPHARKAAALETRLPVERFPVGCPFTSADVLDDV